MLYSFPQMNSIQFPMVIGIIPFYFVVEPQEFFVSKPDSGNDQRLHFYLMVSGYFFSLN